MLLNEHSMQKSNKIEELSTVPDMAWAHSIMKMEVLHRFSYKTYNSE